jgi:hypothetical protein
LIRLTGWRSFRVLANYKKAALARGGCGVGDLQEVEGADRSGVLLFLRGQFFQSDETVAVFVHFAKAFGGLGFVFLGLR